MCFAALDFANQRYASNHPHQEDDSQQQNLHHLTSAQDEQRQQEEEEDEGQAGGAQARTLINPVEEEAVLHSVSLKLYQTAPSELSESFKAALWRWLSIRPVIANAYLSRGCVEVICDSIGPVNQRLQDVSSMHKRLAAFGPFEVHHNGVLLFSSGRVNDETEKEQADETDDQSASRLHSSSNHEETQSPSNADEECYADRNKQIAYKHAEYATANDVEQKACQSKFLLQADEITLQSASCYNGKHCGRVKMLLSLTHQLLRQEGHLVLVRMRERVLRFPLDPPPDGYYNSTSFTLYQEQLPSDGFMIIELETESSGKVGISRSNAVPVVVTSDVHVADEVAQASRMMSMQDSQMKTPLALQKKKMTAFLYCVGNALADNLCKKHIEEVASACDTLGWLCTKRRMLQITSTYAAEAA